eukprot:336374_1
MALAQCGLDEEFDLVVDQLNLASRDAITRSQFVAVMQYMNKRWQRRDHHSSAVGVDLSADIESDLARDIKGGMQHIRKPQRFRLQGEDELSDASTPRADPRKRRLAKLILKAPQLLRMMAETYAMTSGDANDVAARRRSHASLSLSAASSPKEPNGQPEWSLPPALARQADIVGRLAKAERRDPA